MARIYTPTVHPLTTSPLGQLRLISDAFDTIKGGTVKEITEIIKPKLKTVQDPTRVVMFYMIHLSKLGKVKEIGSEDLKVLRSKTTKTTTTPKGKTTAKKTSPKSSK